MPKNLRVRQFPARYYETFRDNTGEARATALPFYRKFHGFQFTVLLSYILIRNNSNSKINNKHVFEKIIPSKVIKTGDAIKLTTINAIDFYGTDNTLFITTTIKGGNSIKLLRDKYGSFISHLPKSIKSTISVFGFGPQSLHIHMVAFTAPSPQKSDLDPLERKQRASGKANSFARLRTGIIRAKRKAKFGRVFSIEPIRNPEAVGGYLRRNYLDMDEYRNRLGPSLGSKFRGCRYYRLPSHLKIDPSKFSRHTDSASRYRCAMTGLAQCVGTPIGEVQTLETETGLSFEQLRHVAFGLCNTTPGNPKKWPQRLFQNALTEAGSLHMQFKTNRKITL